MDETLLLSKVKGAAFAALAGDCIGGKCEVNEATGAEWAPVPFKTLLTLNEKLKTAGTALAALAGDCIGGKCEFNWESLSLEALQAVDKALKTSDKNELTYQYSDDSEMAFVLAQSLVDDDSFYAQNVAKRFSETYFNSPIARGYGGHVGEVFIKLKDRQYAENPFKAASEQFDGEGSYGNGSAMRVYPVALFYHGNMEEIEKVAAASAQITHAHVDAINGAILQAMCVEFALSSDETKGWKDCWTFLKEQAEKLESKKDTKKPFTKKLDQIFCFLNGKGTPSVDEITEKIGTGIQAVEAVSAAIFAFLWCLAKRQPQEFDHLTKIQQTIYYAISLGGDTDTIGTMTGAIAGAFYGDSLIPDYWLNHLEGKALAEELASKLFERNYSRISDQKTP